jgi:hypothetical protein
MIVKPRGGKWKWLGQSAASRQQAAGGVSPRGGKRNGEGGKSLADDSIYRGKRERERERQSRVHPSVTVSQW